MTLEKKLLYCTFVRVYNLHLSSVQKPNCYLFELFACRLYTHSILLTSSYRHWDL